MLSMGKSTISMAIFNSYLYVYQRVPKAPTKKQSRLMLRPAGPLGFACPSSEPISDGEGLGTAAMLDTLRNVETETQLKSMGVQIWKNNNKSNPESLHKLLLHGNFFNRKFSHVIFRSLLSLSPGWSRSLALAKWHQWKSVQNATFKQKEADSDGPYPLRRRNTPIDPLGPLGYHGPEKVMPATHGHDFPKVPWWHGGLTRVRLRGRFR